MADSWSNGIRIDISTTRSACIALSQPEGATTCFKIFFTYVPSRWSISLCSAAFTGAARVVTAALIGEFSASTPK